MKQYIDKAAIVAEIEKRKQELRPTDTHKMQVGEKIDRDVLMWLNALTWVKKVIDTLEVKEINNVWHDIRRTIPEDGSEQIICIKEDGLAVSTVGKIVNGTIKWAYLDDLLNTNSFNVKVKGADECNDVNLNPLFEEMGVEPDSRIALMFKNAFYKAVDNYLDRKENNYDRQRENP